MRHVPCLAGLSLVVLFSSLAPAEPLRPEEAPEPLRPWVRWVLHGHEDASCPVVIAGAVEAADGAPVARRCAWPGRLTLDLGDRGGTFEQTWQVYRATWVRLPGGGRTWPQDVHIDGAAAVVVPRQEAPAVRLAPGAHRVAGRIEWLALPPLLQVPPETGLLALHLRGAAVPFPSRDAEGRLWLQRDSGVEGEESRLALTVHRLLDDDVPFMLTTRIELSVSGRGREVTLGQVLPEGFVPMSLAAAIPARLDAEGRLVAQVRPGTWTLTLVARHEGPLGTLTRPASDAPWPDEEVWVFNSHPSLRQVSLSGAPALDPQQTTLPPEWRTLPAFLLRAGDTLTLEERQRGDADPAPDRLDLQRTWWLDFDGVGFTVRDSISGTFVRSWRLELPAPAALGRVAVDGRDQLITRRGAEGAPGFEVRQGAAAIEADSRLPRAGALRAVGWDADFQQAGGELRLPPGWRLFHATGVDDVRGSWIASWTLLDLFLVLVTTLAAARLWGRGAGLLALAALALSWIEPGAPRWCWVAVVATGALLHALGGGRLRPVALLLHGFALVTLLLWLVPFLVVESRVALYPQLEQPGSAGWGGLMREGGEDFGSIPAYVSSAPPPAPARAREDKAPPRSNLALDPNAASQTGPGVPEWSWRSVGLEWRGPVERTQRLRLILVPPWFNALLGWARIGLLAALAFVVLRSGLRGSGTATPGPATAGTILLGITILAAGPARADFPTQQMLQELQGRLLEPPECLPDCVAMPRMALEATPSSLRLRVELHAGASVAAPLPGGAESWLPEQVILDGTAARALARSADGRLWIALTPGTHEVLLEGSLPDRVAVALPLPLHPHRVDARAAGWSVEGLRDDGTAEDSLQLVRQGRTRAAAAAETAQTLPPFVRVERDLELGLRWEVRTRVVRLTPVGAPVLLEVPLLVGESVTSDDVRVSDGRAVIGLGADAADASWTSVLDPTEAVALTAPRGVAWVEVWRATIGPVWHVEAEGIPTVHAAAPTPLRVREWHPWPGESVTLHVTRPAAAEGATVTIDSSRLTFSPGLRASDATLELAARASRGGPYAVALPEGAELLRVAVDGRSQPIRLEGSRAVVPLSPGAQHVSLEWREARGTGTWLRTPGVRLESATVNATTVIELPANRWPLGLRGPRLGPAVLFWSWLVVALLASLALGATRLTPLRWHSWFLLSLGLTQVPLAAALIIAAWLLALGWRQQHPRDNAWTFDALQLLLGAWSVVAVVLLFWAIQHGLLGLPEMQIAGNGSSARHLVWDLDRTDGTLPRPAVLSVPLLVYRLAMLAWSLWLAWACLGWLRWGWGAVNTDGLWKRLRAAQPTPTPPGGAAG